MRTQSYTKFVRNFYNSNQSFFPRDVLWVALATMFWYFLSYIIHPVAPGNNEQYLGGWNIWHDQSLYLKSAQALARLSQPQEVYVYPLGYPAIIAPFVRFLPRHAFLLPNLFFAIGIAICFYSACKAYVSKAEAFSLTVFFIFASALASNKFIHGRLVWENAIIVPWNLIPVFFAAYLTSYLIIFQQTTSLKLVCASTAIGIAFFCRPPDALFLFVIYAASLVDLKTLRERVWALVILAIPTGIFAIITLISKLIVYGTWYSRYDLVVRDVGFSFHNILYKLYLVFADGMPIHLYGDLMLIPLMPWILLIIPGLLLLVRYTTKKVYFLMAAILLCVVIYVSFNGMAPTNVYSHHGYRYFAWFFPWLGLFAYLTVTRSVQVLGWRWVLATTLPIIAIVLATGWTETVVNSTGADADSVQQADMRHSQNYSTTERKFLITIDLADKKLVEGVRIFFLTPPSYDFQNSFNWEKLQVLADGQLLKLYQHYNLFQHGNTVIIAGRNPFSSEGGIKQLKIIFNATDQPEIEEVMLLQSRFQLFAFARVMLQRFGLASTNQLIRYSPYRFGEVIDFGKQGKSNRYKLSGWSGIEKEFTWAIGNRSQLGLRVPPSREPLELRMEMIGLVLPPKISYQTVQVSVNGKEIGEIKVSKRDIYTIKIPAEAIQEDGNLTIVFKLPNATTPKSLGINMDPRQLSVAVFNITLAPQS